MSTQLLDFRHGDVEAAKVWGSHSDPGFVGDWPAGTLQAATFFEGASLMNAPLPSICNSRTAMEDLAES